MREILFRGKPIDEETIIGNDFYYGDLCHYANGEVTIRQPETGYEIAVFPETVGQFTGLTDKNGVKIFEVDLLQNDKEIIFEVQWHGALYGFSGYVKKWDSSYSAADFVNYIIIGNVHDNQNY